MPFIAYALKILHFMHFVIYGMGKIKIIIIMEHARPLEGGKWLCHKEGGAYSNLTPAVSHVLWNVVIIYRNTFCKMGDFLTVFFSFAGKSQHEIKLYLVPSALKSLGGALHYILFRDSFIYNITESLRTRFRSKCKRTLLHILNFVHNIKGERIDSKGRQGNVDFFLISKVNEKIK